MSVRFRRPILAAALATALATTVVAGSVAASPARAADPARVPNPFAGAAGYVNPDWSQRVAAAAAAGGELGPAMTAVAAQPTAVWLDRIAAITAGRGLRGHLDAALAQQRAAGRPLVLTLVLYDLPNRSCERLTEPGELRVGEQGLARYRAEFVDPIARILAAPRYSRLRIAAIVEPLALTGYYDSPWHPVGCTEARTAAVFRQGVGYALTRLHAIRNVYTYLDVGNAGAQGYGTLVGPNAALLAQTALSTPAGFVSVHGFVSNTTDYVPTAEPFLLNQQVRTSRFYDFGEYVDAPTFSAAMRAALVAQGFPGSIGMLIDTSRNGWGGPGRPPGQVIVGDTNTLVDLNRVDRRPARTAWCNQVGAGLGAFPQADPTPQVQAYVWVKPPGESDGSSASVAPGAIPGSLYDRMCDPTYRWPWQRESKSPTGALPESPLAGEWHPAQFEQLVRNAYPPIS